VSVTRLKNLLRDEPEAIRAAFVTYAAIVNSHSRLAWPSSATAGKYVPTGRSSLDSFTPPALIGLRLRALFGVSARADIVRVVLAQPDVEISASDLVPDVNHTKRNINKELDSLRLGGLLQIVLVRNEHRYRLHGASRLLQFIGELPEVFPRWTPIARLVWNILETMPLIERMDEPARMVEARRLFRQLEPYVEAAGLSKPNSQILGDEAWSNLVCWVEDVTAKLAMGDSSVFR
jgi:hypothetical protein